MIDRSNLWADYIFALVSDSRRIGWFTSDVGLTAGQTVGLLFGSGPDSVPTVTGRGTSFPRVPRPNFRFLTKKAAPSLQRGRHERLGESFHLLVSIAVAAAFLGITLNLQFFHPCQFGRTAGCRGKSSFGFMNRLAIGENTTFRCRDIE